MTPFSSRKTITNREAGQLIAAKGLSLKYFEQLVLRYRHQGFSDAEIVVAMAACSCLIDPIGDRRR